MVLLSFIADMNGRKTTVLDTKCEACSLNCLGKTSHFEGAVAVKNHILQKKTHYFC
jgi:hypothetical protein